MLDQIVNDQVQTIRDNIHVHLVDEGFEPGVAFDLSNDADLLEILSN